MELKDFLAPFCKRWKPVLLVPFTLGVLAYICSSYLPLKYQASATIYVQRTPEQSQGEFFTYEGYYAYKAAQEYADTITGFLESPDIIRQAGLIVWESVSEDRQRQLQNSVSATKVAPQLVQVVVTFGSTDEAKQILTALVQAVDTSTKSLNQLGGGETKIGLLTEGLLTETVRPRRLLNALVAAGAGIIIVCVWVWLREYVISAN
ncbi:hypothetical protein KJ596_02485 [Patescibacteria group bacterium]|nr:hypothetical protein [Patescibacteria group bacterium]MBU1868658.1 hypothetical protein [Patescibacteria group bacterium]